MQFFMQWMIYGANGYTGKLIAHEAARQGLTPVLAGRREENIRPLADALGLPWRVFELARPKIDGIDVILHCAGPFSKTSQPLADALLSQGKHYLDITGEIAVFESLFRRQEEAKRSGSIVIPGVGFDVVPTDCLASLLKEKLPSATRLELAMAGAGKVSPGTLKSMIEGFHKGGWIRKNGQLVNVPTVYKSKTIRFTHGTYLCSSIPWGDVSTAYHSTGIPNIIFYAQAPKHLSRVAPFLQHFKGVVGIPTVQNFLKAQVDRFVKGPSAEFLQKGHMHVWGRVEDAEGKSVEGWVDVPEGYYFTALAALRAVNKVLEGKVSPGVFTPSLAFGAGFIEEFPEAKVVWQL